LYFNINKYLAIFYLTKRNGLGTFRPKYMKADFLVFIVFSASLLLSCSKKEFDPDPTYYYWYGNEKIPLQINPKRQVLLITNIKSEKIYSELLIIPVWGVLWTILDQ